ncbi:MAG: hypothetical protein M1352_02170 [Patescibacteria group bacterium]|nr:hypothetical protein [Patescibacteria group bacterium]
MPNISTSLFIKEPGRTKNLILLGENLSREVKNLKRGNLLQVKSENGKVRLYSGKALVGEVADARLSQKIKYVISQKAEVLAIFVSLIKAPKQAKQGGRDKMGWQAAFLLKASLPVFADEPMGLDLKPFLRSSEFSAEDGEQPADGGDEAAESDKEENLPEEETNPLFGLRVLEGDSEEELS